jgi:hypothetical protein
MFVLHSRHAHRPPEPVTATDFSYSYFMVVRTVFCRSMNVLTWDLDVLYFLWKEGSRHLLNVGKYFICKNGGFHDGDAVFLRSVRRLLVTDNVVPR